MKTTGIASTMPNAVETRMAKKKDDDKPVTISARVTESVVEAARDAAWHVGHGYNLSRMVEEGLKILTDKLAKEHNGGKPFARRTE